MTKVSDNAERWSVWISIPLARSIRIYAATKGVTQRDITETALKEWAERNPLSAKEVLSTVKVGLK